MTRAALIACLLGAACRGGDAPAKPPAGSAAPGPREVLPADERQRGEQACAAYVTRICGCADRDATTWADRCHMAHSMPQALALRLDVGAHPDTSPALLDQLRGHARKQIAKCIELTAALEVEGCR